MAAFSARAIDALLRRHGGNHIVRHAGFTFEQAREKDGPACLARHLMNLALWQEFPRVIAEDGAAFRANYAG